MMRRKEFVLVVTLIVLVLIWRGETKKKKGISYYEKLGVSQDSTIKEIKKA